MEKYFRIRQNRAKASRTAGGKAQHEERTVTATQWEAIKAKGLPWSLLHEVDAPTAKAAPKPDPLPERHTEAIPTPQKTSPDPLKGDK